MRTPADIQTGKVRMAAVFAPAESTGVVQPEPGSGMRYLARQPILDLRGRLHGYELLFRSGPETAFRGDGDLATRTMLDNSVIFGLEKLSGGVTAFVNCTQESLTEALVDVLPPGMTVLEILETIDPTPAVVTACRRLKAAGFRLALDDFTWKPGMEPLVEMADYVKVDFIQMGAEERKKLLHRLSNWAVALVAEKVETQSEFQQAREEGFTLIQGYYFCRPILLKKRSVPANRLSQIEILRVLHEDTIDLREVSRLVKRDTSLTYRLLRLINSPLCAVRQEVCSVEGALIAVGEDVFRRIATLAITSELNADQPQEVLRMAFVGGTILRARGQALRTQPYRAIPSWIVESAPRNVAASDGRPDSGLTAARRDSAGAQGCRPTREDIADLAGETRTWRLGGLRHDPPAMGSGPSAAPASLRGSRDVGRVGPQLLLRSRLQLVRVSSWLVLISPQAFSVDFR